MYRILIAEDEHLVLSGIRSILEWKLEGIAIVGEAEDGEQALELCRLHSPDLLITDIRMPKLNGLEVIERLKQVSTHTQTLMVSGYDEFEFAQQAIRLGATDYLLKPIEADHLAASVRKLMEAKRNDTLAHRNQLNWYLKSQAVAEEIAFFIWNGDLESLAFTSANAIKEWFPPQLDASVAVDRYRLVFKFIHKKLELMGGFSWKPEELKISENKVIKGQIHDLFQEHIRHYVERIQQEKNWGYSSLVEEICEKLEEDYANPEISLKSIGSTYEISPAYLSQIFKNVTGESFLKYLTDIRMKQAQKLLVKSTMKLYEISEATGYLDYPHFSKQFKKNVGVSPSEFREKKEY